jgi:hypothetical protein
MNSSVDRLALVSKVILDQRVLELRSEVERCKLDLFWEKHGSTAINNAMVLRNYGFRKVCLCGVCVKTRTDLEGLSEDEWEIVKQGGDGEECKFKPYFLALAEKNGITVVDCPNKWPASYKSHFLYSSLFFDVDCHLLVDSNTCKVIGFGTKLSQCKFVTNEEMQKLTCLMSNLLFSIDDHSDELREMLDMLLPFNQHVQAETTGVDPNH